jgi:hypothetical protein
VSGYCFQDFEDKIDQRTLLDTYDRAQRLCKASGVVTMDKLMGTGDAWLAMAHVDALVELGRLVEVQQYVDPGAQNRIFRMAS